MTKKSQAKAALSRRGEKTPLFIVLHAKWQKSRGRNASESYRDEYNPSKALQRAIDELTWYDAMAGTMIQEATREMCWIAGLINRPVNSSFNEIALVANPGDDYRILTENYLLQSQQRHERYVNSDEYKEAKRRAEEEQRNRDLFLKGALSVAPEKLTLKDEAIWNQAVANNADPYGSAVIRYADRWARLMESQIASGSTVEDCADECSHVADSEGITGFMYGCAVSILSAAWVHGELLRRWHNHSSQLGDEGDRANEEGGVLNPAILNIG